MLSEGAIGNKKTRSLPAVRNCFFLAAWGRADRPRPSHGAHLERPQSSAVSRQSFSTTLFQPLDPESSTTCRRFSYCRGPVQQRPPPALPPLLPPIANSECSPPRTGRWF